MADLSSLKFTSTNRADKKYACFNTIKMVWPFTSSDDPLSDLDPKLRKFIKDSRQVAQDGTEGSHPVPEPPPEKIRYLEQIKQQKEDVRKDEESYQAASKVPRESLFPDGRYAHIWKTFRSSQATSASQPDSEIIRDIGRARDVRRQSIEKIAHENCALEALAENECWKKGSVRQKLSMCREETQALDRCTQLQIKFLHALGYLTDPSRDPQVDDRIQLHADKLYQQMIEHEKAIKLAKEQGLPAPEFKPVMSRENLTKVLGLKSGMASLQTPGSDASDHLARSSLQANADLAITGDPRQQYYKELAHDKSGDESVGDLIKNVTRQSGKHTSMDVTSLFEEQLLQERQAARLNQTGPAAVLTNRIRSWFVRESNAPKS